jgi:hypothetical protein
MEIMEALPTLENLKTAYRIVRNRVILPIARVHPGTIKALKYAETLSNDITAVHICIDPVESDTVVSKWSVWGDGVRLVVLNSPYRLFLEPLLEYVDKIFQVIQPNEMITLVMPQSMPKDPLDELLHSQTAELLRKTFFNRDEVVVIEVPYQGW